MNIGRSGRVLKGNDGLGTTTITTHEDKLSVVAEHMNNAYMAVQGILQAHAEKNGEDKPQELSTTFTFSDFDKSVKRTWKDQDFKDAVSNASLGLTGESGEVADLIKKAVYHERMFDFECSSVDEETIKEYGKPIKKEDVKDELSDVLFYISAMAQEFGYTLEDVALHNKAKLEKRYEKGFTVEESANKNDKHEVELWRYYDKDGNLLDTMMYPDSKLREESYRVTNGTKVIKDRGGN